MYVVIYNEWVFLSGSLGLTVSICMQFYRGLKCVICAVKEWVLKSGSYDSMEYHKTGLIAQWPKACIPKVCHRIS